MMIRLYTIIAFCLFFSTGCNQSIHPNEYREWFESNEYLKKSRTIGDYTFDVRYRNGLYNYLKNQTAGKLNDTACQELKNTHCFLIEISSLNQPIEISQVAQGNINYLMSDIQRDFTLKIGDEDVPCKLHHFERSFDLKQSLNLIAIFEYDVQSKEDLEFQFEDNLFNTGRNTFRFDHKTLSSIPNLTI